MAETIFLLLLENSVVFGVLFGGVCLIKRVFATKMSVRMHYLIWVVVVIKLLLPFSVTAPWSPGLMLLQTTAQQGATVQTDTNKLSDTSAVRTKPAQQVVQQDNSIWEQTPAEAPDVFNWITAAVILWLAGIAFYTAWLWRKRHQLRKAVCRSSIKAPKEVQQVFLSCQQAVGVRTEVRMMIQEVLQVPAATGVLRPLVLVPPHCTQAQLEHAFTHELTHIKRRDIIVIWGLNFLRALYWFNPLVWICTQLIQRDMEADCDNMALDILGQGELSGYIDTILYFSGKDSSLPMQAAMSLNDGCLKMKQRIRSMFMRKRTKRPIKLAVLFLTAVMTLAAFTSGCGAVPVRAAKAQNVPIAHWRDDDIIAGNMTVKIDAEVVKPDKGVFSIYETQRTAFSPELIDNTIAYFFGDNQPDSEQSVDTVRYDASSGTTDTQIIISDSRWEGGKSLIWTDTDGGTNGSAYIVNSIDNSGISPCIQISAGRNHYFDRSAPFDRQPEGVTLTPDQAMLKAQAMLDELGLDGIKPRYVYACSVVDDETGEFITDLPGGYDVVCIPSIDDMDVGYAHELLSQYSTQETIDVFVNDSGVVRFDWINHWDNGYAAVDVALLPFDDIKRIFKDEIQHKYKKSTFEMEQTVYKVALELARVNTSVKWKLVPAWCFYINSKFSDNEKTVMSTHPGALMLAINAVDGSVIE